MIPFETQLASRYRNSLWLAGDNTCSADPSSIEFVAANNGFVMNSLKVGRYRLNGIARLFESQKLRMMGIPTSTASQDGLREQRFPPECDKATRVEVTGMQRPQSHLS